MNEYCPGSDRTGYSQITDKMQNKLLLFVLLASATLTVMSGAIISPVQNLIRDGLQIDPAYAGSIITTHGLSMAVFSLIMGSIVDRKGVRAPFIYGLFLFGIAGGAGLIINSYWSLIISRVILGIALSSIFTCINVIILNSYEGKKKRQGNGMAGQRSEPGRYFMADLWEVFLAIYHGISLLESIFWEFLWALQP